MPELNPPPGRTPIICTGTTPDGYAAPGDNFDISIDPAAIVNNGVNPQAVLINANSSITNAGSVTSIGPDTQAVKAGDSATIINLAPGFIEGGSGATGYGVWFSGTDSLSVNTLTNDGFIDSSSSVAIKGSVGSEQILLNGGSTMTGDIELDAGDDQVTLDADAILTGNVDLGAGNDGFSMTGVGGTYNGDVTGGDGNDTLDIAGTAIFGGSFIGGNGDDRVDIASGARSTGTFDLGSGNDVFELAADGVFDGTIDAGAGDDMINVRTRAIFNGSIDLGASTDVIGAVNNLSLEINAFLTGNVNGGLGSDSVDLQQGVSLTGDISLGGGDDLITIGSDASIVGSIILGDEVGSANRVTVGVNASLTGGDITGGTGADSIELQSMSSVTLATSMALGGGDDQVTLNADAILTGNVDLGSGNDQVTLDAAAILTGDVDLGAGNDGFSMTGVGGTYNDVVTGGDGNDTLDIGGTAIFGGNFIGGNGDDRVDIASGARSTGAFNLGPGNDVFELAADGVFDGTIDAGAGDDMINVKKRATFNGTINFGEMTDATGALNELILRADAVLVGDVTGGPGTDKLELQGASITGDITLGAGDDTISFQASSSIAGTIDLGPGDDLLDLATGITLDGSIDMGLGADTVVLFADSSITGILDLGAGDDLVKLKPTADLPSPPSLSVGSGIDTLQLDAFSSEFQAPGTLDLSTANQFDSLLVGSDAGTDPAFFWTVTTSATASFDSGIVLQSGALLFGGTVDLTGDFTQNEGSIMVFELGQGIDDSMLNLSGKLILVSSPSAQVTITGSIIEGDITLLSASGGITGDFGDVFLSDLALFDLSTALGANDFVLTATRTNRYDDFARNSSEKNVAVFLEAARLTAGAGAFTEVVEALELQDVSQFSRSLGQLHAGSYDAHTSSILSWGRLQQRMLQQRPMRCERFQYVRRPEIVSESPCGNAGFMPWAKLVGDLGRHTGGEPSGYDTRAGGLLMGVDRRWGDDIWFSGDIGFARLDVEHDNGAKGNFDSIDLGAAAGIVRGALSIRSSLTYSHGFHEATRQIDFLADRVKGKFDSDRVSLEVGARYRTQFGPFVVEPGATLDYSHVAEESLRETGNPQVALSLNSRKSDVFAATAGLRLSAHLLKYRFAGNLLEWADGVWNPVLSAQWRQAFGDVDRTLKAEMQGAPAALGRFGSKSRDSDGGFELGGHLTFQPLSSSATFEFGYDAYFGDEVVRHALSATVRVPF